MSAQPAPVAWRPALLALGLLSVIWGYNWVVMKLALRDADAIDFAALRTILGALALFAVLAWRGQSLRPPDLRGTVLLGLVQTTLFVALTAWAVEQGGAGRTAVLVYTMPFWVLVLGWPLLGERILGLQWAAVAAAFIGLLLLVKPWVLHEALAARVIGMLAALAWAASVIIAKRLGTRSTPELLSLTAWQMLFGAIPLLMLAVALPSAPMNWTPGFMLALAFNVIPANAIAWLLWLYALNHLPAGIASFGMLATPVIGVLAAWWQLGEQPGPLEGLGMLCVVFALALLSLLMVRARRRVNAVMAQE